MPRSKHPNKHIEASLQYAESHGWLVDKSMGSGHCWGQMCCPTNNKACWNGMYCRQSVWSTPRSAEGHARDLRRIVDKCQFLGDDDE